MKVSSASTIPLQLSGLVGGRATRNRCRQRNAVVGCTPQSSAVLARLLPSIIARAWSSQRSFLRRCAIGVLVSALNVRPQALQRNRESPCERPQATTARPAQCGQPWASTRSRLVVPSASSRRSRLLALPRSASGETSEPERASPRLGGLARAPPTPPLAAPRSSGNRRKPPGKSPQPSSNQSSTPIRH